MQPDKSLKKLDDWRALVRPHDDAARPAARGTIGRRIAPPLFAVVGLAVLGAAVHESNAVWRLESSGARAPGVVRSLEVSNSHSSTGGVYYSPVVTYDTSSGQRVSFKDHRASNPPEYRVGQAVTVLYRPDRADRAIIDRGILNWLGAAALCVLGALFTLFALVGISRCSGAGISRF